jgi:hypothetical protein
MRSSKSSSIGCLCNLVIVIMAMNTVWSNICMTHVCSHLRKLSTKPYTSEFRELVKDKQDYQIGSQDSNYSHDHKSQTIQDNSSVLQE